MPSLALRELLEQASSWRTSLDRLEAGETLDRAEAQNSLDRLLEASQALRDSLFSRDPAPRWHSQQELRELIEQLEFKERRRYQDLADLLTAGTIEHRSKRTETERLGLRDSVVAELRAAHAQHNPPELPGPSIESWLPWAWALEDGCEVLQRLESSFPQLEEFLRTVEPEWWQPGPRLPGDDDPILQRLAPEVQKEAALIAVESPANDPEPDSQRSEHAAARGSICFDINHPVEAETEMRGEEPADPGPALSESVFGEPPSRCEPELTEATSSDEAPSFEETPIEDEIAPSAPPQAVSLEAVPSHSSMSPAFLSETSEMEQPQPLIAGEYSATSEALVSFETYRAKHLVGPRGFPESAPWLQPNLNVLLRQLITDSLQSSSLPRLLLAVRAAEVIDLPNLLDSDAVRHMAHLLRYGQLPMDAPETLWQQWATTLLSELHEDLQFEGGSTGVKLLAFIHGFSSRTPLSLSSLLGGGNILSFENGALRAAFELFHQRSLTTQHWMVHLSDRLDSNQLDRREALEARIRQARQQFRTTVQQKQKLRNLVTSLCREAWASFWDKTAKDRSALLLDLPRDWNASPMPEAIERWATTYQRTMEHAGAKYIDRKNMDAAFNELSSQALTLSQMLRSWNKGFAGSIQSREAESAEIGQLNSLFNSDPLEDPEEELCRLVARSALRGQTLPGVCLELTLKDISERPLLLEFLDELPGPQARGELPPLSSAVVAVDDLIEPLRVVARLLEPGEFLPPDAEFSRTHVLQALSRLNRADLEDRLIAWMDESEKRKCWNDRRLQVEELERNSLRMSELGAQLSDLTDGRADIIRGFSKSLHTVSDRVGRPGLELPLLKAWAVWIIDNSSVFVDERVQDLRLRSSGNDAIQEALDRKDYWLATAPVDGVGRQRPTRLRETMFRPEGQRYFSDPRSHLREIAAIAGTSPIEKRAAQLADSWLSATLRSDAPSKKLRDAFLKFVFQAKLNDSHLLDCFEHPRSNAPFRSSLNCESIRIALAKEGVNPSYLPQLADIRKLQVIVPENITVSGIENPTKALPDDLCVVLAPNVTQTTRRDVRQHAKSRMVTVLDDLDLCRLLDLRRSTEVAPLLGLFEIVLEQQRWERVDPYQTQDGQLIRMEMFVGRMEEGERLARSNDYKKLFSGRKLGKSALLRYVQDRFDKEDLPSGNKLRVIYLSLVDRFQEHDFVTCVLEGIEKACDWKVPNSLRHQKGGWPMLRDVIRELLDDEPKLSLLIVADEADKFVRQELDSYRKVQEECLSFRLRSELEQLTDSRQLPRIRFLFAGYRETNRAEGAWSNWGSTLRLSPLDPSDATSLLAGPLARLGIDLGDMAATVAYRCGFQPAVLLRAGKALLTRMDKQRQIDTSWEYIKVMPSDVTAVLEDSSIRDEIRQVINNNFSQNKLGQILFHTVAILLADRPFGYALEHPEQQIRAKLLESDPSGKFKTWLMADERSTSASILMELEELQQRKLLVEDPGYRLAFPHHVAALGGTQQLITILQQQIRDLPVGTLTSSNNGPLSFFATDEVNRLHADLRDYATEPKASRLVRAVLAISHWIEPRDRNPVLHPSCGILALLGCNQERRIFTADEAKARIDGSDQLLLLPGGADLLRWALNEVCDDYYFYDHAAVRRLSLEDLQSWFARLYEIELTSQQLTQMARLTGGIPLLVGELHRLIVPNGSEPPDKLHDGSWEKVQSDFGLNLPSLARQLRDGTSAIRLMEREIEILKMVSLASQYGATSQQLSYDLTEGWDSYDRPDLRPIGTDDEASVTLLQDLGLLPMHRAFGLRAVEALVPLEATDPLHTLLQHLDS